MNAKKVKLSPILKYPGGKEKELKYILPNLPENCKKCDFLPLCRNGCYRHRSEKDGIHFFCDSYKRFFGQCLPQLKELAYLAAAKSQT